MSQYKYLIKEVSPKDGSAINPYHEMMRGKECNIITAAAGYSCLLSVRTLDDPGYDRAFVTSKVLNIDRDKDTVVIETKNTVYTFILNGGDDMR